LRAVQRFVVRRARYVIVPSGYFKTVVEQWGARPERLKVIYNGVEPAQPEAPRSVPPRPYMVGAGRLVPWKGFDMLIRLLLKLPEWHLVVIGDGPERKVLEALAQKEGVAGRVVFTGELARAQVLGWCKDGDAFVLNTSFESFSFQVVEAMMAGARIVTTSVGSLPELVEQGKEGVLLTPGDTEGFRAALESTRAQPEVWQARREAAKR
jgi:glycosyltransferase involved in cell wall biosynthesis